MEPTLLIIGTRDRTAPGKQLVSPEVRKTMGLYDELGKITQKSIPDAQLLEIENVGHLPHIEKFEAFINPLLIFLKNNRAQSREHRAWSSRLQRAKSRGSGYVLAGSNGVIFANYKRAGEIRTGTVGA